MENTSCFIMHYTLSWLVAITTFTHTHIIILVTNCCVSQKPGSGVNRFYWTPGCGVSICNTKGTVHKPDHNQDTQRVGLWPITNMDQWMDGGRWMDDG